MHGDLNEVVGKTGSRSFDGLSDDALELRLRKLLAAGARTEALVVAHLAEVECRRLHVRSGYRSLFEYCLVALGFSEFEAVFRISAARTTRNFPLAFELLERGELHLSGLHLLRSHLTPDNHVELLGAARLKSKRDIEKLIAARFPRPGIPANVRPFARMEPLSSGRYRLELMIDEPLKEKLERACDRLSHVNPSRDLARVLDRALDALMRQLDKGRLGKPRLDAGAAGPPGHDVAGAAAGSGGEGIADQETAAGDDANMAGIVAPSEKGAELEGMLTTTPSSNVEVEASENIAPLRKGPAAARSHIPWRVARAVAERDEHRCTFVSSGGIRCGARGFLQLHHEQPWARGGADTIDNLRLLCAAHNALLAEQDFGREVVARARERARLGRAASGPSAEKCAADGPSPPADPTVKLTEAENTEMLPIPDKVA
jgi:hypothetical protein